jgi:hypothetical protein
MRPSKYRAFRNLRSIGGILIDSFLGVIERILFAKKNKENWKAISVNYKNVMVYSVYVNNGKKSDWSDLAEIAITESYHPIIMNTGNSKISTSNKKITVINRRNIGRDIASYGVAISLLELAEIETLLLLNDSMEWNHSFIRSVMSKKAHEEGTILSLTISKQGKRHLQTYLLVFNSSVMKASLDIMTLPIYRFKRLIVKKGEIHLSQKWIKNGYKLKPLFETNYLMQKSLMGKFLTTEEKNQILSLTISGVPLNPSIHFWEGLFSETGSIKKSIQQKNPAKYKNLAFQSMPSVGLHLD